MGKIGNFRQKGYILKDLWQDNGFGGQEKVGRIKRPVYISVVSSNGKEMFVNNGIFNQKNMSVLVRRIDAKDVTSSDKMDIEGDEYNITNVEYFEKDRNYYMIYLSRELISGD